MRLIECYIENFGKICKQKFEFNKGLNKICQNNSAGKTTLSVFIKVMLYGMSETKKTTLSENERKHYLPWSGAICAGSLTFAVGTKAYRVERSFGQKNGSDTFALYDLDTGKVSTDYSSALGEELFGIDADGFERTVFLSERALSPKSENKSVSAKLSDLVGADGDIGGMDEAIKTLENERKLLYKKGGAGKIADIKASITDAELELSSLEDIGRALEENSIKAKTLSAELEKCNMQLNALATERGAALAVADREKYAENLNSLKAQLTEMVKRQDELIKFFSGHVPTFEEIDKARLDYSRAASLLGSVEGRRNTSSEYAELSELFKNSDVKEIDNLNIAYSLAKRNIERKKAPHLERATSLFKNRIPSIAEIDKHIESVTLPKSRNTSHAPLLIALILALLAGICCGVFLEPPYRYVAFGIVAVTMIISGAMRFIGRRRGHGQSKNKTEEFILDVMGELPEGNQLELLYEMRSMHNIAVTDTSERDFRESLNDLTEILATLCVSTDTSDPLTAAEVILSKYARYRELHAQNSYAAESDATRKDEAATMMSRANEFLSRYPVSGENAFAEIRAKLLEYNSISTTITEKRREIENFATLHKIGEFKNSTSRPLLQIDDDRAKLEAQRNELTRELGALNAARNSSEMRLFRKDEIIERKELLTEELERREEELKIILLTQKYLTLAKDSLTSKYLGKTKSSFDKYTSLISGISGERFEMSTDFGISKLDGGVTRPSEAYSKGTRELYAIASRFALCDSLYDKEKPFIILDDPFASLDDDKCRAAMKLLRELGKEKQIIYFTCSESRM